MFDEALGNDLVREQYEAHEEGDLKFKNCDCEHCSDDGGEK